MKSQRTLLITNINVDWGKFDGYPYDDNGGHPDGNLLLPSTPLDESDPGVAEALAAGAGRMVDAFYYDANEDRIGGWAGYGDEVFVIIW